MSLQKRKGSSRLYWLGLSWIQAVLALRRRRKRKKHFPMGRVARATCKREFVLDVQCSFLEMKLLYNQTMRVQQGSGPCSLANLP